MEAFKHLWIEKYRPSNIASFICTEDTKNLIDTIVKNKEIPNLLLVGNAGIGKTSLGKIIINDILKCQYLYINASDENGIDTVRSKINSFAQTKSLDGGIKIVFLDEADAGSMDFQRALRNVMEEYAGTTRFILTGNYKHKIIPPIQSRCQTVDLTFDFQSVLDRVVFILDNEKIEYDKSNLSELTQFIKLYFPDLRKIINEIQKCCVNGKLCLNISLDCEEFVKQIFTLLQKNVVLKLRKFVIENEEKFNGDYQTLLKALFNYVDKQTLSDNQKRYYLITLSNYLFQSVSCIDQEINFYACLIMLSEFKG